MRPRKDITLYFNVTIKIESKIKKNTDYNEIMNQFRFW